MKKTIITLLLAAFTSYADNLQLYNTNKQYILYAFTISGPQKKLTHDEADFAYKFKSRAEKNTGGQKWTFRDLEGKYYKAGSLDEMKYKDAELYQKLVKTAIENVPEDQLIKFINIGKKLLGNKASNSFITKNQQKIIKNNEVNTNAQENKIFYPEKDKSSSNKNNFKTENEEKLNFKQALEFEKKKDYKNFFILMKQSAEFGNPEAQRQLAWAYEFGMGTQKNLRKAVEWYETAAKNNNKRAMRDLAYAYKYAKLGLKKDLKKSFKFNKQLADQGDSSALVSLALMYQYGEGTLVNYRKAFESMQKAANAGNKAAESNLGLMYYSGTGTYKNFDRAIYWLQKAAEKNDSSAQFELGSIYIKDKQHKDLKKAKYWINKAYENGSTLAETYWNRYELWKY